MFNICLFEDDHYVNFLPLAYTRPVYELICGFTTIREKIISCFPKAKISLHCREYLAPTLKTIFPKVPINQLIGEDILFIKGRILPEGKKFSEILSIAQEKAFLKGQELVAIRLKKAQLEKIKIILKKEPMRLSGQLEEFASLLPRIKLDKELKLVHYLWELIHENPRWIEQDASSSAKLGQCLSDLPRGAYLINKKNIFINHGVEVSPGVVISGEAGPVIIEKKVKIFPQATITGPVYVGEGTLLKVGAQIYPGTTLGRVCKIGGEVEGSIIHNFTNKQHHGFIGHSYLGSWINLGAGTTNSDLKNNYSSVKVYLNDKLTDTGSTFVGLFMGDHSKTGINSIFNTGTVVGLSCNLFGSQFPPKFVPSFSWGEKDNLSIYKLEKSLETAERVMARRGKKLSSLDKELFRKIFNLTKPERKERGF